MNLKQKLAFFKKYAQRVQKADLRGVRHADLVKEAQNLGELHKELIKLQRRLEERDRRRDHRKAA